MDFVCGNCKCIFNRNAVSKYHFDYGDEAYICPICKGFLIDVENEKDLLELLNMNQDIDAMFDRYLSNQVAEHYKEPSIVCDCNECGEPLRAGDDCYYINGDYYCEDCIFNFKVELDTP